MKEAYFLAKKKAKSAVRKKKEYPTFKSFLKTAPVWELEVIIELKKYEGKKLSIEKIGQLIDEVNARKPEVKPDRPIHGFEKKDRRL